MQTLLCLTMHLLVGTDCLIARDLNAAVQERGQNSRVNLSPAGLIWFVFSRQTEMYIFNFFLFLFFFFVFCFCLKGLLEVISQLVGDALRADVTVCNGSFDTQGNGLSCCFQSVTKSKIKNDEECNVMLNVCVCV